MLESFIDNINSSPNQETMLIAGDFNLKLNKANEFLDLMNI
jgi:hypothetical protein